MKKMLWLCIFILCFLIFISACKNTGYKHSYNTSGVLNLISANELSCEVIDIKVVDRGQNHTELFIELYIPEIECSTNKYFCDEQYELPPGIKDKLIDYGVKNDSIANFGINYKDFIVEKKNRIEYRPYYIYWFKLIECPQNKYNVLVYASIPYEITIENTKNIGDASSVLIK